MPADKAEALRLFRLAVEQGEEKAAREVELLEADFNATERSATRGDDHA